MKRIVIVANFCGKLDGTANGRFLYLAEMLSDNGYEVEIVTSDFEHGTKCSRDLAFISCKHKNKITYIHEPGYEKNISLRRLYSHKCWGINVARYLHSIEKKPDYVYCAVPSLTAAAKALAYCKKNKIKFIIDIQDLWPEAFSLAIKNKIISNVLCWPMKMYANRVYRFADCVIAVSETYLDRVLSVNLKNKCGLCVFLGADVETFDAAKVQYNVDKPINEIWIVYVGTLGYSYDLDCVIDALVICKKRQFTDKTIRFVVIGDGPFRTRFEAHAKEVGIAYTFYGNLPYSKMVGLMCSCDIVVNPINKGAAQSITNKVGDYAFSSLPVINTQENSEYRNLVTSYKCGINCDVGNSMQVANAIALLINNSDLREKMGIASRKLGNIKFNRRCTYYEIVKLINSI